MTATTPRNDDTIADGGSQSFVAYEYLTIRVPREKLPLYQDTYAAFGWTGEAYDSNSPTGVVTVRLKRDRNLPSKAVLAQLQASAEGALRSISILERSRTTVASITATSVGIAGSALLAGSIFTMQAGHLALSIVLGVVGLVGWALPWFAHRLIRSRRTVAVAPLIDHEYDAVNDSCERAASLLP